MKPSEWIKEKVSKPNQSKFYHFGSNDSSFSSSCSLLMKVIAINLLYHHIHL